MVFRGEPLLKIITQIGEHCFFHISTQTGATMSKSIITYILIGSLIVIAGGSLVFGFLMYSQLRASQASLSSVSGELQTARSQLVEREEIQQSLEEELEAALIENKTKEAEISDLEVQLNDAETRAQEASDQIAKLEGEKKEISSTLTKTLTEKAALTRKVDFYKCEDSINMDYSGVMPASSRLMAYVDGLPKVAHTSTSYRNTIWNNTDTKIYGIRYVTEDRETFVKLFLVYYSELGWKRGVFYIDEQCWLDSPVK